MRHARIVLSLAAGLVLGAGGVALLASDATAQAPADAGADAAKPAPAPRIPPDPPPMNERMQWVFHLRWQKNEVYLISIHKTDMADSHPTPRVMGRFALELFEGPTLIERVRFDFPMLGMEEISDAGYKTPIRFLPGLNTRIGVYFPATKRGTRLELWDRATNRRWPLPWPPVEGTFDGGAPPPSGG